MNQLKVNVQQSILTLAAHGWSRRRIARELKLDRATVRRHLETAAANAAISTLGSGTAADSNTAISTLGSESAAPACDDDCGEGFGNNFYQKPIQITH